MSGKRTQFLRSPYFPTDHASRLEDDMFPFMSLPAELRTRIYNIVLSVSGPIHPSTDRPSSTPKKTKNKIITTSAPQSALSLLAVNRQINDEAFGIFYHCNSFEFFFPTQLHAFILSLTPDRLVNLRDVTVYYHNAKSGGIDLAELTFPALKQLSGLRRLHVILRRELTIEIRRSRWWLSNNSGWRIQKANPMLLPGIKVLLSLRGIRDIKIRDLELERDLEEAKKDKEYPKFSEQSRKACIVQVSAALDYFNKALADAQQGNVDRQLFDDSEWHMKVPIPEKTDDDDAKEREQA